MRSFKKAAAAILSGVIALAALAGCSQSAGTCTVKGTATISVNGTQTVADAPVVIAADGQKSYTSYEVDGSVIETLSDGTSYYQRTYAQGTEGGKWTKSAAPALQVSESDEAKSGTMTIDGKEYQTLTYDDVCFYCYDGGSLKYIYSNSDGEEITIKITSISTKVDSNLLKVPAASEIEAAA